MKKQFKKEKKLTLNKVRLMKISEMKIINGGNALQLDGNDDPITKPKTNSSGL